MKRLNLKLAISLVVGTLVMVAGVWLVHGYQLQGHVGNLKKEAEALVQQGKKPEALRKYTQYLQQNEDDSAVYVATAKLAVEIADSAAAGQADQGTIHQRFQQAYDELNKGLRHNHENAEFRERYAEFMMKVNRFDDAREHLEWLTRPERGNHKPKLDLMLAACYMRSAFYKEAMELYAKMTGYDAKTNKFDVKKATAPEEIDSYVFMAQLMREQLEPRQPKAADIVMEQLVTINKDAFKAHLARAGYLYLSKYGDINPEKQTARQDAAKKELGLAESLAPDDPDVILFAAQTAQSDRDLEKCERLLAHGLKLFPKNVAMYRQWAILKVDQNKSGEAREIIEKQGLKWIPKDPNLLWILAEIQLQQRDMEAARGTLKTLTEIPDYPRFLIDLMKARMLFYEQKWLPASREFERLRPLLAQSPEHAKQADLFAAQCYEQLGQYDKQLDACRRVLAVEPNNLAAQVGVASALMGSGKTQEAKKEYELLGRKMGSGKVVATPQVWVPIIELWVSEQTRLPLEQRNWAKVDYLVDLMEQQGSGNAASVALIKAEIQLHKGNLETAYDTLDKARTKSPNDPALWSAVATIVLQQKGQAAALKVLDEAPEAIRGNVTLRLNRAGLLLRQGGDNVKSALAELDIGSDKLTPSDRSRLWSGLGSALFSIGDREGAMHYWIRVADADPTDLRIRFSLFDAAREVGDDAVMSRVLDDMRRIMGKGSVEAEYIEAARLVAQVRSRVRKRSTSASQNVSLDSDERQLLDSARKLLGDVSQARPGWYEVARVTGDAELLDGNVDAAIAKYQQALKVGPPNAVTIRALVMLLTRQNRMEEMQPLLDMVGPENLAPFGLKKMDTEVKANKKDFEGALAEAMQEVKNDSKDPYGHMWIGHLYDRAAANRAAANNDADAGYRQKMRDEAEAAFRRAIKTGPELPETWLVLIDHLMANKKNDEASKILMDARKELPEDRVNQVLGPGYEALGETVLAEQYYRAALEAAPHDLATHRLVSMFYMRNGRTDDARKEVVAVLRGAQNSPSDKAHLLWSRRAMADILVGSGEMEDFRKAKALLIANTKVDDDDPEDRIRLANLLASRFDEPGMLREAIKQFEMVKSPLGQQDRMTLAKIHDVLGDRELAREEMFALVTQASQSKPDPNLYGAYVEMLLRQGKTEDAANWLDKLGTVQPAAELLLRTRVLVKQGRRDEAVQLLARILPPRPVAKDKASSFRTVAILMDQLGLNSKAEDLYREYMSYVPGTGALDLAAFLGRTGRLGEALDLCETALKTEPHDAVLQVVGEVLRGQPRRVEPQHLERVQGWYDGLLREDPGSPPLLLQYADFLVIAGQDDKSEKIYRDVLALSDLKSAQRAVALNNLSFVLASQRKDLPEALELINQAGNLLGLKSDVLDTRGMVHLAMRKYPEAVADFSDAVLTPYPSAIKLLHLAAAQNLATDRNAARETFRRAKEARLDSAALSKIDQGFYEQLNKDVGL